LFIITFVERILNKMLQKLINIANIQTGIYKKPEMSGDAIYLQAKDFNQYGELNSMATPNINLVAKTRKHLLKDGDVLLIAKGINNQAMIYRSEMRPAVASSTFLIVRVNSNVVSPEYVCWYLNNPDGQQYLKSFAKGTSIPSISIAILADMTLPVPSIDKQKKILSIYSLSVRERKLIAEISRLKELLLQIQLKLAAKQ